MFEGRTKRKDLNRLYSLFAKFNKIVTHYRLVKAQCIFHKNNKNRQ